jgi:hypothetical protein
MNKSLKDIWNTPEGRSKLAMSMLAPLRRRIDYAGMARKAFSIKYLCFICNEEAPNLNDVYINLDFAPLTPKKTQKKIYSICDKCLTESRKQVKKIKRMNLKNLPLHISDPNIFVREAAIKRLEKCQNQNQI